MSVEGAFGADREGAAGPGARPARDPRSLVSTRLTRELISADASSDFEREDAPARASRLLAAALSSLSASQGAILRYEAAPRTPSCLAVHGIAEPAIELLEGRTGTESLAQRACAERRLFILDRSSREALLPALRAGAPEITTAAVIPLYDHGLPVAALVLADDDVRTVQASSLRLLTPAFHLLGVLLSPGRAGAGMPRGEESSGALDQERYVVELEELGNLLHEARESARLAAERAASTEAEHRAIIETSRARIAELEASASRAEIETSMRRDLESAYAAQGRRIEERERRIAELQHELRELQAKGGGLAGSTDAVRSDAEIGLRGDSSATSGDGDTSDEALDEIANAAAAALAEASGESGDIDGDALDASTSDLGEEIVVALPDDAGGTRAEGGDGDLEGLAADAAEAAEALEVADPTAVAEDDSASIVTPVPLVLFGLDGDEAVREAVRGASTRYGVDAWLGDDEPPAGRGLLNVNLFDPLIDRVGELVESGSADREGLAYGRDPESGTGFELGTVTWLARPVDTGPTVACVRGLIRRKAGGIVILSSQLRELSPLREALSAVGVSSSVACDARQALDLLEIVRNIDALLVDLSLDGGQGLSIAIHFRNQSETRDTPLLLLLGSPTDPARLLAGARRSAALSPFGPEEVARMVTATLSRR